MVVVVDFEEEVEGVKEWGERGCADAVEVGGGEAAGGAERVGSRGEGES